VIYSRRSFGSRRSLRITADIVILGEAEGSLRITTNIVILNEAEGSLSG
jgi:hypothetical protein|tara:strand:- start:463 stop:609 length:147 start_codon:yes stop_codon:yes gene_type:complete